MLDGQEVRLVWVGPRGVGEIEKGREREEEGHTSRGHPPSFPSLPPSFLSSSLLALTPSTPLSLDQPFRSSLPIHPRTSTTTEPTTQHHTIPRCHALPSLPSRTSLTFAPSLPSSPRSSHRTSSAPGVSRSPPSSPTLPLPFRFVPLSSLLPSPTKSREPNNRKLATELKSRPLDRFLSSKLSLTFSLLRPFGRRHNSVDRARLSFASPEVERPVSRRVSRDPFSSQLDLSFPRLDLSLLTPHSTKPHLHQLPTTNRYPICFRLLVKSNPPLTLPSPLVSFSGCSFRRKA